MKKILCILVLSVCLTLCACGTTVPPSSSASGAESGLQTSSAASGTDSAPQTSLESPAQSEAADHTAFFEETKTALLSGQEELPEAAQLHWSAAFLDGVDFETAYQGYLDGGGAPEDTPEFAAYLTENAPIQDNWKTLFEQDLLDAYGKTAERYENLGGEMYQVYVVIDGKSVPYVAVNARTGWFHG